MASSENLLTHEEIWDDSSLVNAWDEALQEYKKYHGIDATGGNKQKIIRQAEEADMLDAPGLNQVWEERENIIEYQCSIGDGELDDEGMEHKTTAIEPHVITPKVDTTVEEGDYKQQTQASGIKSGSTDYEQTLLEGAGDQSDTRTPSQTSTQAPPPPPPPPPPFPMDFAGDVKDNEALRNLMMSWYFAGYYTGLYEGQQQRQQSRAQQPPQ